MDDRRMTECESLIMKSVWNSETDLSLQEIVETVNSKYEKNWKPQTVSTFLSRLAKKGFLEFYRRSRIFLYKPLIAEKIYRGKVYEEFVEFWSGGNVGELLCELHEHRPLRLEEITRIEKLLGDLD